METFNGAKFAASMTALEVDFGWLAWKTGLSEAIFRRWSGGSVTAPRESSIAVVLEAVNAEQRRKKLRLVRRSAWYGGDA